MYKDFNRYLWPEGHRPAMPWLQGGDERNFIPDALFDVFVETVLDTLPNIAPDRVRAGAHQQTGARRFKLLEGLRATESFLSSIAPRLADVFRTEQIDTPQKLRLVPYNRSVGYCEPHGVSFWADDSAAYPIYMTHEAGHLAAANGISRTQPLHGHKNVVEIQSFFAEHAAVDALCGQDHAAALAAHFNSFADTASNIAKYKDAKRSIPLMRTSPIRTSAQWSQADQSIFKAHNYTFANLISRYMLDHYRACMPEKRAQMLDVLYHRGPNTSLRDIMEAFDLKTEADFKKAGRYVGNRLARDMRVITPFMPPNSQMR